MLLLLLAMLAAAPTAQTPQDTGELWIRCETGVRVYIDEKEMGVTTDEERGLLLKRLAPGKRHIRLTNNRQQEISFPAMVEAGRMVEVAVSAIGWRRILPREGTGAMATLKVVSPSDRATVVFRGQRHPGREVTLESLPPGDYEVEVQLPGVTIPGRVTLKGGVILTMRADVATRTLVKDSEKAMPIAMAVTTQGDILYQANLPPAWSVAIRSAFGGGAIVKQATRRERGVVLTIRFDDYGAADRFFTVLSRRPEVDDIQLVDRRFVGTTAVEVTVLVEFTGR